MVRSKITYYATLMSGRRYEIKQEIRREASRPRRPPPDLPEPAEEEEERAREEEEKEMVPMEMEEAEQQLSGFNMKQTEADAVTQLEKMTEQQGEEEEKEMAPMEVEEAEQQLPGFNMEQAETECAVTQSEKMTEQQAILESIQEEAYVAANRAFLRCLCSGLLRLYPHVKPYLDY